mgnify:FL=1
MYIKSNPDAGGAEYSRQWKAPALACGYRVPSQARSGGMPDTSTQQAPGNSQSAQCSDEGRSEC